MNLEVELGKLITRMEMAPVVRVEKNIVQPHVFFELMKSANFSGCSHFAGDRFSEAASQINLNIIRGGGNLKYWSEKNQIYIWLLPVVLGLSE